MPIRLLVEMFRAWRSVLLSLLMCTLVCAGAWISTRLSLAVGTVSCIWISNGIISAFVLTRPKPWKIFFLVAGQLASMGIDLAQGDTFGCACWFAVCNSSEVIVTVLYVGHIAGRSDITSKQGFRRIALFGLFLGPLSCALLAAPASIILEGRSFFEAARIWFLSGALGSASTLPLLLLLFTRHNRNARAPAAQMTDFACASALVAIALAVFSQTRYPLMFLLFPPLIATLFRFKIEGAIYGTSFLVVLAAAFTAEANGPFALTSGTSPTERVVLFQIFGLILFATCVPLGFALEERYRLEQNLKQANQKLGELALLDPLTGVHNRRSFDAFVDSEWARASTNGTHLSLLYLDIDFFKRFNDTYGHQMGDECLRLVAGCLVESVRGANDCVARYGGEEFVILLPAATAFAAKATADRVSATILALGIPHKGSPFGVVTASVGISTAHPGSGGTPHELIRLADDALYTAKLNGRGRIETKSEPAFQMQ